MSLCFCTIAVSNLRPHFKPFSVLELYGNRRSTCAYGARGTWLMGLTPTYSGLLKQPDKQKSARTKPLAAPRPGSVRRASGFVQVGLSVSCLMALWLTDEVTENPVFRALRVNPRKALLSSVVAGG